MNNLVKIHLIVLGFLLLACKREDYRSQSIRYISPQADQLSLGDLMNNIQFLDKKYSVIFESEGLRKKMPSKKVVYGGGPVLELGYVIDNIAMDYGVKIYISSDKLIVSPR